MYRIRGYLFALTVLVALAGGAFLAYRLDQTQRRREGLPELLRLPELASGPRTADQPARGPVPEPSKRVAVETAQPSIPAAAPALVMGELRGLVTDLDGRPLAGVRLLAHEVEDGTFRLPTNPSSTTEGASGEAVTDGEGHFHLDWPEGHPARLETRATGYPPAPSAIAFAGEDHTLRLDPGFELFGSITDPSGTPMGGATVRWLRTGEPLALAPTARTGPAGNYSFRVAARPGSVVEVLPLLGAPSDWLELPTGTEPRRRLDVVVETGGVVAGSVRDAETSLPVPNATISLNSALGVLRTTKADSGGSFSLAGLGGSASRLCVQAPGYADVVLSRIPQPADGAARVDLVLEPARAIDGRVVDATGAPVAEARVTAVASRQGPGGMREQRVDVATGPDGRFHIDRLSRDLEHALVLSKRGYAASVFDLPALEREVREHDVGDLALSPPMRVAGRVQDPGGRGIEGVEVLLEGWNSDRGRLRGETAAAVADPVGARVVRSDAQGRFRFVDVPPGDFRLATRRAGAPASGGLGLKVRGTPLEGLELVLDTGGFVAGRVLDPDERPLENVTVFVRPIALERPEAATQLAPGSVRTDTEGRFSLTGLAAGEYALHVQPDAPGGTNARTWLPASLAPVRTGSEGLELHVARGATLTGRLTDSAGRVLPGWLISTPLADGSGLRTSSTAEDGSFTLLVPFGQPCELEVRGRPGTPSFQRVQMRRSGIEPGIAPLELRLPAPGE